MSVSLVCFNWQYVAAPPELQAGQVCTHTHACTDASVHAHRHAHVCVHTRASICTHALTHTQMGFPNSSASLALRSSQNTHTHTYAFLPSARSPIYQYRTFATQGFYVFYDTEERCRAAASLGQNSSSSGPPSHKDRVRVYMVRCVMRCN